MPKTVFRKVVTILGVLFFIFFITATTVFGQYDEMKVDPAQKNKKDEVIAALRGGGALDQTANTYLNTYFFPRWTVANNATELATYRTRELPELLDAATGQAKTELLDRCKKLLAYMASNNKNYYPACRYNTMYALGALDEQSGNPPVPYGPAVPELLKAYQDKSYPDGVRLAALEGLRRHAILGIANDQIRDGQIVPLLIQIALDTPYPPKEEEEATDAKPIEVYVEQKSAMSKTSEPQRSKEIQDWFRMRAIQALGAMKGTKATKQIAETLLTIMESKNENPVIRYEATFALSQLELKEGDIDLLHAANALAELGIDVCDDSVAFMEEQIRVQQVQGSSSGTGGMPSSSSSYSSYSTPPMSSSMSSSPMSSSPMMGSSSGIGGTGTTMSPAQMEQINNSIQRIKYGFSSIMACITGPTYKGQSGMLLLAEKDQIAKNTLQNMQKYITNCIKFLDEGDPEVAKKAAAAKKAAEARATSPGTMSSGGMYSSSTTQSATTAKKVNVNEPKVSMREIEQQLKKIKAEFRVLIDSPMTTETTTAASSPTSTSSQ